MVNPIIHLIIRTIFAKENGIKHLETQTRLLNNPYKIGVILAIRIHNNKATYYFRIQGPF